MFVACKRTEADIVKDVEAEIQDRVCKRKQQLVQQAGGPEHHTRLQQRAQARSPGGQLRRVLTELNEKRTTSELWQMAVEKSHLQRDRFVSPFVQVRWLYIVQILCTELNVVVKTLKIYIKLI